MRILSICAVLALSSLSSAGADIIFQEGFESGTLTAAWTPAVSGDGRSTLTQDFGPATGSWHLVLDDSVNDAFSSVSALTLTTDLSNRKNVVLSFKAKSLGDESHAPPVSGNFTGLPNMDAVSISTDGGNTWRVVQSLSATGSTWTSYSISLTNAIAFLQGGYGPGFRVRFSQYDNSPAPLDGIAFDDIIITADKDQRSIIEMPSPVTEGTGPHTASLLLAYPVTASTVLTISASPSGAILSPETVTMPEGESFATFQFSAPDNDLVHFTRTISVSAAAAGITPVATSLSVLDNDTLQLGISIPPQLTEGAAAATGKVSIDRPAAVVVAVTLTPSVAAQITHPTTVNIPAGQTESSFTISATNDTRIDGNVDVNITASRAGALSATGLTTAVDNEIRVLSLSQPAFILEGASATVTASISGTLTSPLEVSLVSSAPGVLTVPATVTIPASQTQASFVVTAVNNELLDGSKTSTLTAMAATFPGTSRVVTVRDNEVAGYKFGALTDIVDMQAPLPVSIMAHDIEGQTISGFEGTVNMSLELPGGATLPLTPASVTLAGTTGWAGSVTLPATTSDALVLRVEDASGKSGKSALFDNQTTLALKIADMTWDSHRNRIYASVPTATGGAYADKVVVIDPVTAQITHSVTVGQNPGRLALTSGGEYLYVALDANGTVSRLNAATMAVESNFAVGTSPERGTLYAEDMCTVAGQPNMLILSQYHKTGSPKHSGVAVYENGVVRPVKTGGHTGSNLLEPSTDPAIFFGYNTESSEAGTRRLRIDAAGVSEISMNRYLFDSNFLDMMESDGDRIFSSDGSQVDGAVMKRVGSFDVGGIVLPDLSVGRVFYIEEKDNTTFSLYDKIGAYDPVTFGLAQKLTLPKDVGALEPFLRWGTSGLAFRSTNAVHFISSRRLVPSRSRHRRQQLHVIPNHRQPDHLHRDGDQRRRKCRAGRKNRHPAVCRTDSPEHRFQPRGAPPR